MAPEPLLLGRVSGLFGVRGWVKVHSYTEPREGITRYQDWWIRDRDGWRHYRVLSGRLQGRAVVAQLRGVESREHAARLVGLDIAVDAAQLVPLGEGEYYWHQLIGLRVFNLQDEPLGEVRDMMETGANDVMIVQGDRERLIPWLRGSVIRSVDLEAGVISVDWAADY